MSDSSDIVDLAIVAGGVLLVLFLLFALVVHPMYLVVTCDGPDEVARMNHCFSVPDMEEKVVPVLKDIEGPVAVNRLSKLVDTYPRDIYAVSQKSERFMCWEEQHTGYCTETGEEQ